MRQGLIDDISKVVKSELAASMNKFPLFSSPHEGYAVILEEVEEAEQALSSIKSYLNMSWDCVKCNANPIGTIKEIGKFAAYLACEASQVAAMAQKFIKSAEGWK
jgi:hypothetical protein